MKKIIATVVLAGSVYLAQAQTNGSNRNNNNGNDMNGAPSYTPSPNGSYNNNGVPNDGSQGGPTVVDKDGMKQHGNGTNHSQKNGQNNNNKMSKPANDTMHHHHDKSRK